MNGDEDIQEVNKILHEQAIEDILEEEHSNTSTSLSFDSDSEDSLHEYNNHSHNNNEDDIGGEIDEEQGVGGELDEDTFIPPSQIHSSFRNNVVTNLSSSFSSTRPTSIRRNSPFFSQLQQQQQQDNNNNSSSNSLSSGDLFNQVPAPPSAPKPSVLSVEKLRPPPKAAPAVIDEKAIFKEGYLLKEGYHVKSWKNRYFVVRKGKVQYFNKKGGSAKGEISTNGAIIRECPERKLSFCFKIETKDRIWYMRVPPSNFETQDSLRDIMFSWFDAITTYGGAKEQLPDYPSRNDSSSLSSSDSDLSDVDSDDDQKKKKNMGALYDEDSYYGSEDEEIETGYNSDEEIFEVLSRSRQIQRPPPSQQEKRTNEKRALLRAQKEKQEKEEAEQQRRKRDEEEKKRREQKQIKNLFTFFARNSEKQQMTQEEILDMPPLQEDGELQQPKGARTPFGNINILSKKNSSDSLKSSEKLDPEKLKHHMRRQKFIKTFADDNEQNEEEKRKNETFRDLVDDDEDAPTKIAKRKNTGFRLISFFAASYKDQKWFSHFLLFLFGFCFFTLATLLMFSRTDIDFSRFIFTEEETASMAQVNNYLRPIKALFIQTIEIVTLMETSMSESGAFIYRAIYENTSFKQALDINPIFESKAYVGKVLHLGIYASVIAGLIATLLGSSLIYMLPREMWKHVFMRTPFFMLEMFSATIENSLVSTMQWWQWLIVHIVSSGGYFGLFFALKASSHNNLLTDSIMYESYAFFLFVLYVISLVLTQRYRQKYEIYNVTQSVSTVSRYFKLTSWIFMINVLPTILHYINNLIIRLRMPKQVNAYSQIAVISSLFTLMGVKMNQSLILTIGTRYVKQLKYRNYFQFIVQTMFVFVVHTGIMVGLFFTVNIERSDWGVIWGMILTSIVLNMYQCFALNFENYGFVAVLSIFMNLVIMLPGCLIALLRFESVNGVFFTQMICNGVQIIILALVIHGWNMRELKTIWLEISARRRVGDEEALLINEEPTSSTVHHHRR